MQSDGKLADGAFQAMDQVANWVRFADAKATIFTAALGVLTTVLATNSPTIFKAIRAGGGPGIIVAVLAVLAGLAFLWTLLWLVNAISPRKTVSVPEVNRFAWPTLASLPTETLIRHVERSDVSTEAWRQVTDLSGIASRKFQATQRAIYGFAGLAVFAVAAVVVSVASTFDITKAQ